MKTYLKCDSKTGRASLGKIVSLTSTVALLAAGLLAGPLAARAQNDAANTNSAGGSSLPMADQKFMTNAALGGLLEVKLGELAAQKATRDDVKSFAQKMVTDHTQINSDLKSVAAKKGITLPEMLDAKHQKMYEKMAEYSGTDFDKEYISAMVKDHKADARLFKKEESTGDADLKSFVDKALPVVEEHLNMVQGMNKS